MREEFKGVDNGATALDTEDVVDGMEMSIRPRDSTGVENVSHGVELEKVQELWRLPDAPNAGFQESS